ncbi:hypothetical protein KW787_03155 [Candidatus Pacearchaeota archaeon]|nr:hypothetical protein [Candidatus Pacearchaeota archaeon]
MPKKMKIIREIPSKVTKVKEIPREISLEEEIKEHEDEKFSEFVSASPAPKAPPTLKNIPHSRDETPIPPTTPRDALNNPTQISASQIYGTRSAEAPARRYQNTDNRRQLAERAAPTSTVSRSNNEVIQPNQPSNPILTRDELERNYDETKIVSNKNFRRRNIF